MSPRDERCTLGRELLRSDLTLDDIKRFMSKIEVRTFGKYADCWIWIGSIRKDKRAEATPYGKFSLGPMKTQRTIHAHRVSYAIFNGSVPEGMDVDHICLNHGCVNPDHLRVASRENNVALGNETRNDNQGSEVPF